MAATEFVPNQAKTEGITAHVIWLTTGLSRRRQRGHDRRHEPEPRGHHHRRDPRHAARVVVHNTVLAVEPGVHAGVYDAEDGKLDPFVPRARGLGAEREDQRRRLLDGHGREPGERPAHHHQRVDRPAGAEGGGRRRGRHAPGRILGDEEQPTGAMGLADYLGWNWKSKAGIPIVNIPGCPAQGDNITETLMYLVFALAAWRRRPSSTSSLARGCSAGRCARLQPRRLHRAGQLRDRVRPDPRCLVKLGCKGPVVKCNVPVRGDQRHRRLPERRRHLHGVHDAGLPRQVHAVHGAGQVGQRRRELPAVHLRAGLRYMRKRNLTKNFDVEPEWRHNKPELTTGYQKRW